MRRAVIDDIVFLAAPLGERPAIWPPVLSVHLPAGTSPKGLTLPLPFFSRRPPLTASDASWPAYCGLLKDLGIPLQTSVPALEPLSVANVPMRFARRDCDSGLDALELETAEAIEIGCSRQEAAGRTARFPLELSAWHELKSLLDAVRELSGGATPIGLGIVAGDVSADVANALAVRADFVILEPPAWATPEPSGAQLDCLVWSVVAARAACAQAGAPSFPIYVDAPLTRIDDLIKLLALGATAVAIDGLAQAALPGPAAASATQVPKGMLSGIGGLGSIGGIGGVGTLAKPPAPNVAPLESKLEELVSSLTARLYQQQIGRLGELTSAHLRALSEPAARLASLALLAH